MPREFSPTVAGSIRLAMIIVVGVSCSGDPVGLTRPIRNGPSFTYCNGTPAECGDIDGRITDLEHSADTVCQNLGHDARDRYNSPDWGFEMDHNTADAAGYVYYRPVPESADAPLAEYTTGLTYMANTWQNNVEVGRTIAHEEMHHRGITDDGVAESWAQYCVN